MDLLRIIHKDFTLTVESTQFKRMWDKGEKIIGKEKLKSYYRWSDGVEKVVLLAEDGVEREITQDNDTENALFFEQTDYSVWVDFKDGVTDAWFDSARKDVNEQFSWKANKQLLAGFLNYGNEIGHADMPISYILKGERKRFVLSYDVISAKLDYHHDWKEILKDIEQEYRMLSLDSLRRTYHSISQGEGETYDIIWWNVFQGLQADFIKACHNIIDKPRHRLRTIATYQRADQIRHFPPQIEQEFAEHRSEESRLYRVEEQQNTYNTIENRFLKHALLTIEKRYSALAKRVKTIDSKIAESEKERIDHIAKDLVKLRNNPFFRTVGIYEGLKQESLVLQREVNYSKIYRIFNILQKSFSLNDGLYRMETKDIATLYEIWCFISVEKVVKELTGVNPRQHDRSEMSGLFTYNLGHGERSRIVFKKDDITLAELVYNPRHDERTDDIKGIGNMVSPTVPQKPDIVLQLTKDDLQQGMKLTYLFDAKYRLENSHGHDVPPDDAINQMHRYRDAIYFSEDHSDERLKKEILGGYILFPGKMDETSEFYQSIDRVNIGAFPMRPGDNQHELLRQFIGELLQKHAVEIVEQVIPQKGTTLEVKNRVLIGVVKEDNPQYQRFLNGTANQYYSGDTFPTTIPLDGIDYFAPYLSDRGIRDLYEVKSIHTSTKTKSADDDKLRITFDIHYVQILYEDFRTLHKPFVNYTYIDTTLEQLLS